jgi:hypothetical protein
MSTPLHHGTLHAAILRHFVAEQRAPTVAELAAAFAQPVAVLRQALRALADYHGVVLQPNSDEIWVAHPFAAAPTTFVVNVGERRWWGNCAWCSFGLARLAGGSGTITTTLGGLGETATLRFAGDRLLDDGFVVHFPVPMARAWDNVVYTCSVMLLFRDAASVDAWSASRGIDRGDVRPAAQIWRFAGEWYGRHLDDDWRKWTVDEAAAIFRRHGLDGPIWALPGAATRF